MKYLGLILCIICVSCSTSGNIARQPDPLQAMTYFSLADGDLRDKNYDKAVENLKIALEYDPENIDIQEKLVDVLFVMAKENNDWENLLKDIKPIYKNTESVNIAKIAAYAMAKTDKQEKSLEYLRDFAENNPGFESFLALFAFTFEQKKEVKIQYLDRALEYSWDSPEKLRIVYSFYSRIPNSNAIYILEKCQNMHKDEFSRNLLVKEYIEKQQYLKIIRMIEALTDDIGSLKYLDKIAYLNALYKEGMTNKLERTAYSLIDEGNSQINTALFEFSALSGVSTLVYTLAKKRLADPQLTEEDKMRILTQASDYFMDDSDFDRAVYYLKQIGKMGDLFSTIVLTFNEDKQNIYLLLTGFLIKFEDELTEGFDKSRRQMYDVYLQSLIDIDKMQSNSVAKISPEAVAQEGMTIFFADIAIKLNNLEQAEKFLSNDTLYSENTLETISFTCMASGKYELLADYVRKRIDSGDFTEDHYLTLGRALEAMGKQDEKEKVLKEAIKAFPDSAEFHNWLGYWLLDFPDRIEEAGKYLQKARELAPENLGILDSAAWYYHLSGESKKAMELVKSGLIEKVESGIIAYHIGEIFYSLEQNDKAKEFFNKALELPNDEDAHRKAKNAIIKYNLL